MQLQILYQLLDLFDHFSKTLVWSNHKRSQIYVFDFPHSPILVSTPEKC